MVNSTPNLNMRSLTPTELPHAFNSQTVTKIEMAAVTRLNQTSPTGTGGAYTPPADPEFQDAYYVPQGEAGTSWEGLSEVVVYWTGGAWEAIPLRTGWNAYDIQDGVNKTYRYDALTQSGSWVEFNEILSITRNISRLFADSARCTAGINELEAGNPVGPGSTTLHAVGILSNTGVTYTGATALASFSNGSTFSSYYPWVIDQRDTRFQNSHHIYRYVGNVNRQGDPAGTTPTILSAKLILSSNTAVLRRIQGFEMYHLAATSTDSQEVNNARSVVTNASPEVSGDDMATNFPPSAATGTNLQANATPIGDASGFSEVPSTGQADYDYVVEREFAFSPTAGLSAGTIVLVCTFPAFADPNDTQVDVDLTVQLSIENAF